MPDRDPSRMFDPTDPATARVIELADRSRAHLSMAGEPLRAHLAAVPGEGGHYVPQLARQAAAAGPAALMDLHVRRHELDPPEQVLNPDAERGLRAITHSRWTVSAAMPRERPCGSCPYRRGVPSGIWARSEYEALRKFDGSTTEQGVAGAVQALGCHQVDGSLCAGWAGCHDMYESLAVRIGVAGGTVDPAVVSYTTDVPLFGSGAEAADHGERDIDRPSVEALALRAKVIVARELRGRPVEFG